jgi:molybdopterin molybdotransferase
MLDYQQALDTILNRVTVLDAEEKSLYQSIGQVTAEDAVSPYSLPMAVTGVPDGYAVRSEDIAAAGRDNPVTLRIVNTIKAGDQPSFTVAAGTAARIMTGSLVPQGADCVVRFEDTDEPSNKSGPNPAQPSEVKIFVAQKPWTNTREPGSNVNKGDLILPKGKAIGPAQVSALTAIGKTRLKVVRRPVIAVIVTGDELIDKDKPLTPGKAYNCNGAAIAALVAHYGGIPLELGIAKDTRKSLSDKFKKALKADAIITTGGVSMGDYDLVRLAIHEMGELVFSRIKMAPGASFAFGVVNRNGKDGQTIPVFGLSGPPVGCLNNIETLVRPALLKMMGFQTVHHPVIEATAKDAVMGKKPMCFIKWTNLEKVNGHYEVSINPAVQRSMLAEMAAADSLVILPEGTETNKGDKVQVLPLDWRRE